MTTASLRQLLKTCVNWEQLQQILSKLDQHQLQARELENIYRFLQQNQRTPDLKIAYFADHTIDLLPRYVAALAAFSGLKVADYLGPLNQHYQILLNPTEEFQQFAPHLIFLSLHIAGVAPSIYYDFVYLSEEEKRTEQDKIIAYVHTWVNMAKKTTDATLLITNFASPHQLQAGITDWQLNMGEIQWYTELNLRLLNQYKDDRGVYYLDIDHVLSGVGKKQSYDAKLYYLAKILWNDTGIIEIARQFIRYLKAIKGMQKKALVLDLDNTLWGGIVGEDGIDGIKIGHDFAGGIAYYDFQKTLKALKKRGVILTLASKNNPADVMEVFAHHLDMPLKFSDFNATQINWNLKPDNIQTIAAALNIGIDSFVFLDDNPVEREQMRQLQPQVLTVEMPADPANYKMALLALNDFEKLYGSIEDERKSQQYIENAHRDQAKDHIKDLSAFLHSLATKITIRRAGVNTLNRAHQLFTKTNQFNLTSKRYSLAEVQAFIADPDYDLLLAQVADRFGDLGIVAMVLLDKKNQQWQIDSFILSCRAMGREVETALMNHIKTLVFQDNGVAELAAWFYRTPKNMPALMFYDRQGFSCVEEKQDGTKCYLLQRANAQLLAVEGIEIITRTHENV